MSEPERQHYGEKYEKDEEKTEKEDEKEEKDWDEKNWEEKWRRDPLSSAVWALVIIWAGLALLVESLGLVTRFEWYEAWGAILTGAGLLLFAEIAVRLLVPSYRRPIGGKLILAVVFLGIGLGDLFGWEIFFPLVIIAVGAWLLLRGLFRR